MFGKKGKSKDNFELKVSFKVDGKILDVDVDERLYIPSIDVLTPQKACNMMAENPALHARWNVLTNRAAYEADYAKMQFEIWVKEQSKHYRLELAETTGKRTTDKMVEEAVMTDPEYLRRYHEYLKKREDAANVRSIAIGFGERGERLVNIVSMMKFEKPTANVKSKTVYAELDEDEQAFEDKTEKETE